MPRFLRLSIPEYLEEDVRRTGYMQAVSDREWHAAWHDIRGYAKSNFKNFIEEVIYEMLERELRIPVRVAAYLPDGFKIERASYYWIRDNASPSECDVSTRHILALRIQGYGFGEFSFRFSAPTDAQFENPRVLHEWLLHIVGIAIQHTTGERRWVPHAWPLVPDTPVKQNEKALELLLSHCDSEQVEQYKRNNWFIVIGGETGTTYRINRKSQINIDVLNGDVILYRLCTVNDPDYEVPIEDQLLAQKTMIELNEAEFLYIAKRWAV